MNTCQWLLVLLEPIFTYLRARRGAKRYHRNIDSYDRNAQSVIKPSKLIAKHFGLDRGAIPIIVYRRYIMVYICFIRIFVLYVVACLLKFDGPRYCAVWLLTTLVLLLITLPTIIKEISVEHRSHQERKKYKQRKNFIDDLREDIDSLVQWKQWNVEMKAFEWKDPLTKELDRCIRKQKGKKYIPLDYVNYVEKRILSKYQTYVYYELVLDEKGNRKLSVYAKKDNRLIYQVDIKNK